MRSLRRYLLAARVAGVLVLTMAAAGADEPPPPTSQGLEQAKDNGPIPRIDLAMVGMVGNGDALSGRVLSFFAGGSTETHSTRLATLDANAVFRSAEFAGVRVWISMPTPTVARLVFAVQESESDPPRFLVNEVTLAGGLDEVGQENLAQVVYLSAQALWAGTLETSQKEVEERLARSWRQPAPSAKPQPKPEPAPAEPPRPLLDVGVEYVLRYQGEEGLAHGPGAMIGAGLSLGDFRPGARLHLGVALPRTAAQDELSLELAGGSVRVGAAASWRVSPSVWISLEAGPGLDVVRYSPKFTDPAVAPEESRWDFRPFIHAGADVRWSLAGVSLTIGGFVAVQLQRTHYDITTDGVRQEVLVPAMLQPGIAVGIVW